MAVTSAADSDPNYSYNQMVQQKQLNRIHANALKQVIDSMDEYDGPVISLKRPTAETISEAENAGPADPKEKFRRALNKLA